MTADSERLFEALSAIEQAELGSERGEGRYQTRRQVRQALDLIGPADKKGPLYAEISQRAGRLLGE